MVSLGRVVVDDIEDDLDAGVVHGLDELLEFLNLPAFPASRVLVVRGQVRDRVVAPVVPQAFLLERRVLHELVHREQLDGGNAKPLQVLHRGRMRHPGVGAPDLLGNLRVTLREASDVCFVDDRPVPGCVGAAIAPPVEKRVHDDSLGNEGRAVEIVSG